MVGVGEVFRLYDGRTTAYLGEFSDRRQAWAAADDHLIAAMLRRDEWVTGEYLVISVDPKGVVCADSQVTYLGPPEDPDECRLWLRTLPGRG